MGSEPVAPDAGSRAVTTWFGVGASVGVTTTVRPATDTSAHLAGFVAGEGCFTGTRTSASKWRFAFTVGLGTEDEGMCWDLLAFLGVQVLLLIALSSARQRKAAD